LEWDKGSTRPPEKQIKDNSGLSFTGILSVSFLTPSQRQTAFWIGCALALVWLLYALSAVLAPFVMGLVLSYMLTPAVNWLCRLHLGRLRMPRALAVSVVIVLLYLVVFALLLILVPVLQSEAQLLQVQLPSLIDRINVVIEPRLLQWFGIHLQLDAATFKRLVSSQLSANQDVVGWLLAWAKTGGLAVVGWIGIVMLLPVVLFYLLDGWAALLNILESLIPRRWQRQCDALAREIDQLLSQFMRGQFTVMLILAAYYSVGLSLAGFEVALPVGILTGLLVFIPYVGFGLGLILALIAALLQFGNLYGLLAVAVIYGAGQLIEGFFLTPRLVGEKIGLHPLMVIFALLAFGQLFGFVGVLVALPASAIFAVAVRHLYHAYRRSDLYRQ
jgi:predicted PurR-regulated permease PerM